MLALARLRQDGSVVWERCEQWLFFIYPRGLLEEASVLQEETQGAKTAPVLFLIVFLQPDVFVCTILHCCGQALRRVRSLQMYPGSTPRAIQSAATAALYKVQGRNARTNQQLGAQGVLQKGLPLSDKTGDPHLVGKSVIHSRLNSTNIRAGHVQNDVGYDVTTIYMIPPRSDVVLVCRRDQNNGTQMDARILFYVYTSTPTPLS